MSNWYFRMTYHFILLYILEVFLFDGSPSCYQLARKRGSLHPLPLWTSNVPHHFKILLRQQNWLSSEVSKFTASCISFVSNYIHPEKTNAIKDRLVLEVSQHELAGVIAINIFKSNDFPCEIEMLHSNPRCSKNTLPYDQRSFFPAKIELFYDKAGRKKNGYFTARLTVRGGRGQQMWKI